MRPLARAALVIGLTLCLGRLSRAEDSPAAIVVQKLNASLLAVLKDAATLGYRGRLDKLRPAVDATYDVAFMAEKSLGPYWKDLSDTDKQRWIALSHDFSVANYAANFDHWGNQTIDLLGEEPSGNDTVVVHTRINDPQGESVEMSYRLRSTDSGWRIVDVFLKGTVSELALRRPDYTAIMEREGFSGLTRTMEGKIADFAAGKAKR